MVEGVHKHRWTEAHGDRVAYQPGEFAETDSLRAVLEKFLLECHINFEPTNLGSLVDQERMEWA